MYMYICECVCIYTYVMCMCVYIVCVYRYSDATRRLGEVEADNGILMRQLQAFMPEVQMYMYTCSSKCHGFESHPRQPLEK